MEQLIIIIVPSILMHLLFFLHQKELNRRYQRTKEKEIEARTKKIKRTQEGLEKKQGIKHALRTYFKNGVRERSYPKCRITIYTNSFVEDKKRSKEAGRNEHLSKPFDMKKVVEVIAKYYKK